jgi:hypothetical protein
MGANRDEMLDRPWTPPGRHWPDRADIIAGRDDLAGGTWMGLNDSGVVACILNRHGSLGPAPGKRSRGELVLEALDHADAAEAARALADVSAEAYRPFNMVIADNRDAWWLSLKAEAKHVQREVVPDGLSMFTAGDRNDMAEGRIAGYLPKFQAAAVPEPAMGGWESWRALLAAKAASGSNYHAMCFRLDSGFGTSSSSLVALPSAAAAHGPERVKPTWLFAAGPPDSAPFRPVDIFPS